jgi:hypothetical protein
MAMTAVGIDPYEFVDQGCVWFNGWGGVKRDGMGSSYFLWYLIKRWDSMSEASVNKCGMSPSSKKTLTSSFLALSLLAASHCSHPALSLCAVKTSHCSSPAPRSRSSHRSSSVLGASNSSPLVFRCLSPTRLSSCHLREQHHHHHLLFGSWVVPARSPAVMIYAARWCVVPDVSSRTGQELEAPAQNRKNRIIRFGKPDGPILLIPTAARGASGTRRGSFSSGQAAYGRKIGKNHNNPRGWGGG